ncbi:MAG: CBS domain-containing protein [Acidobacteria bacterium]|nr:CBS domain-containing protein [Acidobacteriota bacterium]
MRPLLVRDLMTEEVFTLSSTDDLTALYDLMDAEHIRHIPVIDEENELVGLVTHRDLLRNVLRPPADLPFSMQREILSRTTVDRIMIQDIATIEPDAPIGDAAEIMLENKYGCLPVVEGKRLVGILTEADFVRCLAGMFPGVAIDSLRKTPGKQPTRTGTGLAASAKAAARTLPRGSKTTRRPTGGPLRAAR